MLGRSLRAREGPLYAAVEVTAAFERNEAPSLDQMEAFTLEVALHIAPHFVEEAGKEGRPGLSSPESIQLAATLFADVLVRSAFRAIQSGIRNIHAR